MVDGMIKIAPGRAIIIASLVAICLASIVPARTLLAGWQYRSAMQQLDDPDTEELDRLPLTGESYPKYILAAERIWSAQATDPSNAAYAHSISDLYANMASWTEVMETLGAELPETARPSSEMREEASTELRRAVVLSPIDPGHHLAYARLSDGNERGEELEKTARLYPNNSPTRYSVAMECLQQGDKPRALEHAKELARRDDSYVLPDSTRKTEAVLNRPSWYLAFLGKSYLYKALEIGWRTTGEDRSDVASMAPAKDEAEGVVKLFLEVKKRIVD